MGRVNDLTGFLTARLDEDEAVAKAAQEVAPTDTELAQQAGPCVSDATYAHIGRHGPARVLREVEAVRNLIVLADEIFRTLVDAERAVGVDILRDLAVIYSDHPDYRPEWKP